MSQILHVSTAGSDRGDGTESAPLRTIGRAAQAARPGDLVRVHGGEYREWVRPPRGGLSDTRRITFEAAPDARVVLKGSEPVADWEHLGGEVWHTRVPNSVFGGWNPFAQEIRGDWVVRPETWAVHAGSVWVDGIAAYEVPTREQVTEPAADPAAASTPAADSAAGPAAAEPANPAAGREVAREVRDDWTGLTVPVACPEKRRRVFHAEVGEDATVITARMPGVDPRSELIEISVRRSVFFPTEHHVDYVTVRGFEMCHAATPWAPPTADQPGLIGPNWAKGWIIEDNFIHDAACSAISLGKEASTGDNFATDRGDKPGYQYQLESVFAAQQIGWDRERIGSHVVRRNTIRDCGQNAIVGHLGCAFSTIEDNDISRIGVRREFFGHEIAGIKLHAAIDVRIEANRIHDCSLGLWLDWQTQGTRITRNLLHDNSRDLFVEVSHGPYVVDHNVLASAASLENRSQGGAYVNNLFGGSVQVEPVLDRATPYHVPHSTQVAGYAVIAVGDDRFVGNLFLGDRAAAAYDPDRYSGEVLPGYGLAAYDGHPASFDEYLASVPDVRTDHQRFAGLPQPVYIARNVYAPGNEPYHREDCPTLLSRTVPVCVDETGDGVFLELEVPAELAATAVGPVTGRELEHVRIAGVEFEENDGSPVRIEIDLNDETRCATSTAGPVGDLAEGRCRLRVW